MRIAGRRDMHVSQHLLTGLTSCTQAATRRARLLWRERGGVEERLYAAISEGGQDLLQRPMHSLRHSCACGTMSQHNMLACSPGSQHAASRTCRNCQLLAKLTATSLCRAEHTCAPKPSSFKRSRVRRSASRSISSSVLSPKTWWKPQRRRLLRPELYRCEPSSQQLQQARGGYHGCCTP
jgi:hypothetical protein